MSTKTFSETVNQPTVKDGSLRTSLSLTKLAQDATLHVEASGTIIVNNTTLDVNAVVAAALLPAYDNKIDIAMPELLEQYNLGYVIPAQRHIAKLIANDGNKVAGKANPLHSTKKVLTASEYRQNCIKLASIDMLELYNSLETLLADKSLTKDKLLHFVTGLSEKFITEEQKGTYFNMLEDEEKAAEQYKHLSDVGFTDINRISETDLSAKISMRAASVAVPKLAELGYTLGNTTVDAATLEITVVFSGKAQETIV